MIVVRILPWLATYILCEFVFINGIVAQTESRFESVFPRQRAYRFWATDDGSIADLEVVKDRKYTDLSIEMQEVLPSVQLRTFLTNQTNLETLSLGSSTQSSVAAILNELPNPVELVRLNLTVPGMDSLHDALSRFTRVRSLGFHMLASDAFPNWIFEMPSLVDIYTTKCALIQKCREQEVETFTSVVCADSADCTRTDGSVKSEWLRNGVEILYEWSESNRPTIYVDTVIYTYSEHTVVSTDPNLRRVVAGLMGRGLERGSRGYEHARRDGAIRLGAIRCKDEQGTLIVDDKYEFEGVLRRRFLVNANYSLHKSK